MFSIRLIRSIAPTSNRSFLSCFGPLFFGEKLLRVSVMRLGVFTTRQCYQVFRTVIGLVAIDVVNIFVWLKMAAICFFPYKTMLPNHTTSISQMVTWHEKQGVSLRVVLLTTLPKVVLSTLLHGPMPWIVKLPILAVSVTWGATLSVSRYLKATSTSAKGTRFYASIGITSSQVGLNSLRGMVGFEPDGFLPRSPKVVGLRNDFLSASASTKSHFRLLTVS